MKKLLFTLFIIAGSILTVQAQSYRFQQLEQPYISLTEATNLNTVSWFYNTFTIPLPFKISVFGDEIKNLDISNGILYADSKNIEKRQYQLFAQSAELLDPGYIFTIGVGPDTPSESFLKYKVEGVAGSRILKIEVPNAANGNEYFLQETKKMRINFQIWFYENSERIEYRYGTNSITDFKQFFNDGSIDSTLTPSFYVMIAKTDLGINELGLEESQLVEVYYLSGTAENPTANLSEQELGTLTTYPSSGTVYQFNNANLGIDKNTKKITALYPNPTTDFLNISLENDNSKVDYTIFDIVGKIVQTGTYQSSTPIAVSQLNTGIYLIKLHGYKTVKFTKN